MVPTPRAATRTRTYALYPLRLGLAFIFVRAGVGKLMGWSTWVGAVEAIGFPLATATASLVVVAEVLGGLGILLGVLARFSGAVLAVVMLAAIWTVNFDGWTNTGWFYDLSLLVGCLTIAMNGAGRPTVWSVLERFDLSIEQRLVERVPSWMRWRDRDPA